MYPRFTQWWCQKRQLHNFKSLVLFGLIRSSIVIEKYRIKLILVPIILAHHESKFFSSSQIILLLLPINKYKLKKKSYKTVLI